MVFTCSTFLAVVVFSEVWTWFYSKQQLHEVESVGKSSVMRPAREREWTIAFTSIMYAVSPLELLGCEEKAVACHSGDSGLEFELHHFIHSPVFRRQEK